MSTNIKRQVSGVKSARRSGGHQVKGFTLIELLIVVAIISILVSIGAVSFSRVQRQGRDTTRKADLQEVASALEQFYSDNNTYPQGDASFQVLECDDLTAVIWGQDPPDSFDCSSPNIIYLADMPGDPRGTDEYRYQAFATDGVTTCDNTDPSDPLKPTCQKFTLSAKLEREGTLDCDNQGGGSAAYDLCVNNP